MQLLLPALAAAHGLGLVVAEHLALGPAPSLWLAVQVLALGSVVRAGRTRVAAALLGCLLAGVTAGAREQERARRHAPATALEVVIEARVEAVSRLASGVELLLVECAPVAPDGVRVPERILLRTEPAPPDAPPWRAGSRVRAALRLRPVRGRTNPGGRDAARSLARRGIGALAREVDPRLHVEVAPPPAGPGLAGLARLRRPAADRLSQEGRGGALLAALALGEASGLGEEARRDLARLGLSHLVAVSGLHLWLVAGPVYLTAAALLRRSAFLAARLDTRQGALGAAVGAAALYAALTGLAAPVQRALVFLALLGLARHARRRLAPAPVLAAAALAATHADAAAPFAPGVQLSFVATAALLWSAAPRAAAPAAGIRRALAALATALRISASATAATAPLVALHFGVVSSLGWLANGFAVPLTAFLLLPLALAVAALAGLDPAPGSASALAIAGAAALAARGLDAVAWLAARTPAWSGVAPGAPGLIAAAIFALASLRSRGTRGRLGLALLAAAAPGLGPPPSIDPAPPRVVALDVGQGDAVIVQGRGASLLVDGGSASAGRFDAGARVVVPALGALGVRRLALVVASHADLDHAGGLSAVLRTIPVERLWLPPGGRADPALARLVALARLRNVAVAERAAGDPVLVLGDLRVETLWPRRGERPASRNDGSLVLRVSLAGCRVLLPGDLGVGGERSLVAAGTDLTSELLKLGHHGSRTATSRGWLRAVSPRLAIVSAPLQGRFGMPHEEVVAALAAEGVPWRFTGRDGAVLVGLSPALRVRGFAAEARSLSVPGSAACGAR